VKGILQGIALAVAFLTLIVVFAGVDSTPVRIVAGVGIAAIAWILLRPFIVDWLKGLLRDIGDDDGE